MCFIEAGPQNDEEKKLGPSIVANIIEESKTRLLSRIPDRQWQRVIHKIKQSK
ncbi:hypothetical protein QG37_03463 [Candidozyma auris]|uniref:Uncharacterized protein n=1 Tax=Candidozyma auris TaxID=498019 RepID=A0A0L0P068_CANAR|nr:hypothetical protein QG37_03463 [[Candida] auris]